MYDYDLEFADIEQLVEYRLVTGQSGGMSEFIEFTKIFILNSTDLCVERLFSQGYLAMEDTTREELESEGNRTIVTARPKSIFDTQLTVAKKRYLSGQTANLKEIFTVLKMIITQDVEHNIRRLESEGMTIIHDPKYEKSDPQLPQN